MIYCSLDSVGHMGPACIPAHGVVHATCVGVAIQEKIAEKLKKMSAQWSGYKSLQCAVQEGHSNWQSIAVKAEKMLRCFDGRKRCGRVCVGWQYGDELRWRRYPAFSLSFMYATIQNYAVKEPYRPSSFSTGSSLAVSAIGTYAKYFRGVVSTGTSSSNEVWSSALGLRRSSTSAVWCFIPAWWKM